MTARERLLQTLFETEGRKHVDVKFCRGSSGDISQEDLCHAAWLSIMQIEHGWVEVREHFGDQHRETVDVSHL